MTTKTTTTTAAKRQPAKKAEPKAEEKKGRQSTVVTPAVIEKVTKALAKADPTVGLTLRELEQATGLTYRQVHNATWRMEGSPAGGSLRKPEERVIRRINSGRKVYYALRKPGDSAFFRGKYATRRED